jgi:Protein of unknown function (DUF1501)
MFVLHNQISDRGKFKRREFLRIGGMGFGASLTGASHLFAENQKKLFKDRSVVFLFMHGGPSQYETFDPKMQAPSGIRSATGEVATSIPGVTFGSTFVQLAKRAHLFNIVRSFATGDGNHDIKPIVGRDTLRANMGSLYARIVGPIRPLTAMPTNVALFPKSVDAEAGPAISSFGNFESSGEFGTAFSPFVPGTGAGLQQDMQLNLPQSRLSDRRSLLTQLDSWKRLTDESRRVDDSRALEQLAFDALARGVADAFDLSREDPAVIARYDTAPLFRPDAISKKWNNHKHYADHGTSIGKLLLLARRLCERGCGFVTVTTSFVWDMHADVNNATMQEGMGYVGAPFDHAVAAFMDDIEARGLRDKIVLVCCGEMGRTPVLNNAGGRDHWGNLAPLLLYGGGLKSGQVVGQSSRDGGTPASDPVTIADLMATIMHSLLDMDQVRVTAGLPRNLLEALGRGTPIRGLT